MEIDTSPTEEVVGEPVTLAEDPRPFLSTPFEEYTVTEGLLLAILLCLFVSAVVKIIKSNGVKSRMQ